MRFVALGQAEGEGDDLFLRRAQSVAVNLQKKGGCGDACAFIAVQKGVILNEGLKERGGFSEEIGVKVFLVEGRLRAGGGGT